PAEAARHRGAACGSPARQSAELPLSLRVGDHKRREAHEFATREPRTYEDPFRLIPSLLHGSTQSVELREPRAFLVRQQEAHFLEASGELVRDSDSELLEPFARQRRDLQRVVKTAREPPLLER